VRAGDQSGLVAAFEAGCVEGAPGPVEHVRTHVSEVFLTRDRAFKLKRAVKLPFVDFTTLESRRAACEAELAVNRRMAAPFYLGVSPVGQDANGRYRLDGCGTAIDWVVVMRRFDRDLQFDRLAADGRLSRVLVEQAAQAVARMHGAASVSRAAGGVADYAHIISKLRETEAHGAAYMAREPGAQPLFDALERELFRLGPLIERRLADGKVRRGHGDLHLRNICVYEDAPMLFDALEFDERLATTDIVYDIAFLIMDLRRVGLHAHANVAMNAYWDAGGEDEAALQLLGFFMALRAAVRMAVAVESGEWDEAQTYHQLGRNLLERAPPLLVAIGGLSGVGKSAVAAAAAARFGGPAGARLLRSDIIRKQRLGLDQTERAMAEAYSEERRSQVYAALASNAAAALAAETSVIADATFQSAQARALIETAARGARFHAFWLDAPKSVRIARVKARAHDASDADAAIAGAQEEPRELRWPRINADRPLDAIVKEIVAECANAGANA